MRKLENWLKSYLLYTSFSEAPESMHFWVGVGTIAGALRRKVWIEELYFNWTPNFYIIFVAPPAVVTKSTTLDIGRGFLAEVPGINFGPDSLTWQALVKSLSEAREDVLIDGEFHPMSCLTFYSSEFGSLVDFQDTKMITVLTDLWDGKVGSWKRETRTQGTLSAVNPWINIIAATTPAWLSDNLPKRMIGGGFMSRCLLVYASQKKRLVAYPSREKKPCDMEELSDSLLHDLEEISMLSGKFTVTEEAYRWGEQWYKHHWENVVPSLSEDGQLGYAGRKFTMIHKLAMVLSAAESNSLIIEMKHLEGAEKILSALEADIGLTIRTVQTTEEGSLLEEVGKFVERSKKVTRQELWRRFMHKVSSYKAFSDILEGLIQCGAVEIIVEAGKEWVRCRKP